MTAAQDQTARDAQLLANLRDAIRWERHAIASYRAAEVAFERAAQQQTQASRARLAAEKAVRDACE